ncbi:LacI family DNA-binding transcriptional regulator [Cellulomonas endometrii]|uniref:LacI family DNA-binding transcriptional regulator n=1 Tax=Cellulomonas endometrii TaxID=3036301 RepID=UPI0024ADDCA8|nr:LacI family DNA-binding transcriptional regulator [Cellulomonas endometrii]
MSLADVAAAAGVSPSTASRAINGSPTRKVRRELQDRVLAAAAELGYVTDGAAQAMAAGRAALIGLIVSDLSAADELYGGMVKEADSHRLGVVVASTQREHSRLPPLIRLMQRQRARAVVLDYRERAPADVETAVLCALQDFADAGGGVATLGHRLGPYGVVTDGQHEAITSLVHVLHFSGFRHPVVVGADAAAGSRAADVRSAFATYGVVIGEDDVLLLEGTDPGAVARRLAGDESDPAEVDLVLAVDDRATQAALDAVGDGRDVGIAAFSDGDGLTGVTTARVVRASSATVATRLALGGGHGGLVGAPLTEVVKGATTPPRTDTPT